MKEKENPSRTLERHPSTFERHLIATLQLYLRVTRVRCHGALLLLTSPAATLRLACAAIRGVKPDSLLIVYRNTFAHSVPSTLPFAAAQTYGSHMKEEEEEEEASRRGDDGTLPPMAAYEAVRLYETKARFYLVACTAGSLYDHCILSKLRSVT